MKLHR